MVNQNEIRNPIQELTEKQNLLILHIQSSNRMFLVYFISGALFIASLIQFTLVTILQRDGLERAPYLSGVLILIFLGGLFLKNLWPFLNQINITLNRIKDLNTDEGRNQLKSGLTTYVNDLFFLLNFITSAKYDSHVTTARMKAAIRKMLIRNTVINGALGLAILLIFLLTINYNPDFLTDLYFVASFSCIIVSFFFIIFTTFGIQRKVNRWLNIYLELDHWAEDIEQLG